MVSKKNERILWAKSAGRCQYPGCNKVLWEDPSAASEINSAYITHIVASSPRGPRGDSELSLELADDLSNLMLLCDTHHRLIDKEAIEEHPVDTLREMKKKHEQDIEYLTSLVENSRTKIVIYNANIGEHKSSVDISSARKAVIPEYFPLPEHVDLSLKNSPHEDHQRDFWEIAERSLVESYKTRIEPYLNLEGFYHISFFGLAPIPLLIKAGALLSDISHVQVRQLMKEPRTWKWDKDATTIEFNIIKPESIRKTNEIALVLSVSANIAHERVSGILPNADIWEIRASEIHNDTVKSEKSLQNFRSIFRKFLSEIDVNYKHEQAINVFPAIPVSIATEVGRVWNGKSNSELIVYDNNRKLLGFSKALALR